MSIMPSANKGSQESMRSIHSTKGKEGKAKGIGFMDMIQFHVE